MTSTPANQANLIKDENAHASASTKALAPVQSILFSNDPSLISALEDFKNLLCREHIADDVISLLRTWCPDASENGADSDEIIGTCSTMLRLAQSMLNLERNLRGCDLIVENKGGEQWKA